MHFFVFIWAVCQKTFFCWAIKLYDCNKITELDIFCPLLTDGERVASTTLIDTLLDKDFQLVINDAVYNIHSPEKGTNTFLSGHKWFSFCLLRNYNLSLLINGSYHLCRHLTFHLTLSIHLVVPSVAVCTSSEHAMELEDMKHVVHLLHTALHLPEHHLLKERHLLERLDNLKQELSPLEKVVEVSQHLCVIKPFSLITSP